MSSVPFKQVDVFTTRPFHGNPVAVILDASSLSTEAMQHIAAWTNLSETTFVLPPTVESASYRLRIFTPGQELPFAGHPTIGSAHAVLESGLVTPRDGTLVQECAAGLIPITVRPDGSLSARTPAPRVLPDQAVDPKRVMALLGDAPVVGFPTPVDVGPVWLVAQVATTRHLEAVEPDLPGITALSERMGGLSGITAFALADEATGGDPDVRLHVRSFAPAHGIAEDPVCGSGNACVGAYLRFTGAIEQVGESYIAAQGMCLGRDGRVAVTVRGEDHVEIGGHAVTVIDGTIRLD